jgi:hypothetical protein
MIRSLEEKTMKKDTAITCVFLDVAGALLIRGLGASIPGSGNENFPSEPG